MVKTLHFHHRGRGFDSWWELGSCMPLGAVQKKKRKPSFGGHLRGGTSCLVGDY